MLPWLSPATTRDQRRVEHSSNYLAGQTRAGTGGGVTCLLPSAKAGEGNLTTVTTVSFVLGTVLPEAVRDTALWQVGQLPPGTGP